MYDLSILIIFRRVSTSVIILLAAASIACQSTDLRYLVTDKPIDVGDGIALCVAVDPTDERGIWWWTPGESGCASRSSGPSPFHAQEAKVSPTTASGSTNLSFRLGTHSASRPFIDVRLIVEAGTMRATESGAQVSVQRRKDLDVPEEPLRGRRPG
jgi:hypothetical protein